MSSSSRVFFEEADRPPNEYFESEKNYQVPLKKVPFQTPDPEKWITAPEFVPRSKLLAETFGILPQNLPPTMPRPFDGIPPGYTANMTTINPTNGPPIAAILLRKKRKRRSKNQTKSMVNSSTVHSISPCSSHPSDPNGLSSSENEEEMAAAGSCPDLTEEQQDEWDDYLYNHVQKSAQIYETISPNIIDVVQNRISGTSNKELQKIDNEINGNTMTSSMVVKKLAGPAIFSDGTTERTLADELSFRNTFGGYSQIDCDKSPYVHITSMDPKSSKIKNSLIDKEALKAYLDEEEQEEDFLEDVETAPTQFQQMQSVLRKGSNVITTDLQAPGNQCCLIM
ncbi:unnamed protein product [Caenorhabditis angaria]|uniref:Uncharacterized protein n=1 Tax=Caenorhabditis angaria TaxID=860376 RepID=A0A9P1IMU6_9PELO|nr:unnamed protein product [Caenorhabditis angaria]